MENKLVFTGNVTFISNEEVITSKKDSKEFKKQYFIVKDSKEYPNSIKIEVFNKPEMFDTFKIGDEVEVEYNTSVNEYNDKHFCSLNAWKVKVLTQSKEQEIEVEAFDSAKPDDDLPF